MGVTGVVGASKASGMIGVLVASLSSLIDQQREHCQKVLHEVDVGCKEQIDLLYQEIISQLQGVKDDLSKEMDAKRSSIKQCVEELGDLSQTLQKTEDSLA